MIRRGRIEGWLKRPISSLPSWAKLCGVSLNGVEIGPLSGYEGRGAAVIAAKDFPSENLEPLIFVPRELILSLETVELHSKADADLREVLDAVGSYSKLRAHAHTYGPRYVKFLPEESLPTFWSSDEIELLEGTSLKPAVTAKLKSLHKEYDQLRRATESIQWCAKKWWNATSGFLSFDDWKQVDAMYRSRALEFPGIGHCMVPVIDMANHASGNNTRALYEADSAGNGLLLLRDEAVHIGEEISITYGDDKGACETIFSYGFIEENMSSAHVIFLELDIPDDDPLAPAKKAVNRAAPGFRIVDQGSRVAWESDFVWLVCVNEEDGLGFDFAVTIDGQRDLKVMWRGSEMDKAESLQELLRAEPLWEVFQLRAVALIQVKVEQQLQTLATPVSTEQDGDIRKPVMELATQLRALESDLLQRAYENLEQEKLRLLESECVKEYLGVGDSGESLEDDFS